MTAVRIFCLTICLFLVAQPGFAQLRPLDPIDFRAFYDAPVHAQLGFGVYSDQLASLAGVRGDLLELGDFRVFIRSGRMVMELAGVVQRRFDDELFVAPPTGGSNPPNADGKRNDSGTYRVGTIVRLTNSTSRTLAVLRFGTTLPTSNNTKGLDRDATDFFATVSAHRIEGRANFSAETGLAINGTREIDFEQADVLVYSGRAEVTLGRVSPFLNVLGHHAFFDRQIRGNEDLSEFRLGVRVGDKRWLKAAFVHGLADASPENGLRISVGASFGKKEHHDERSNR